MRTRDRNTLLALKSEIADQEQINKAGVLHIINEMLKYAPTRWGRLMRWLGIYSECCATRIERVDGWRRSYCTNCQTRVK